MKKLFLVMAAAMLTASVSAQRTAITGNKFGDNWYIGINAGAATPMVKFLNDKGDESGFMKGIAPSLGVRIGKNFTTVFGMALDMNAYFQSSEKSGLKTKTFINYANFDLMATFNLSNLFAGYLGQPRPFEVIGLVGGGYTRVFGGTLGNGYQSKWGGVNLKTALDFAFNLGEAKAVQLYIEPAIVFGVPAVTWGNPTDKAYYLTKNGLEKKFNGTLQLSVGRNYKFMNSNGTHNFKIEELRDQAEIDGLNAKINELRADNNAKDGKIAADAREIADLKKKLADCESRPAQIIEKKVETLQPVVIFRQGKSVIDPAQYASIEMIAKYLKNHPEAKVKVQGYASSEGPAELNQKLSEKRADVVKNALIKRYKISKDRITVEGLGATDKISDERDFNRVAMFIDTTK